MRKKNPLTGNEYQAHGREGMTGEFNPLPQQSSGTST